MDFERPSLLPWYLNSNRLSALFGTWIPVAAQETLVRNNPDRIEAMRLAADLAGAGLISGQVPDLTESLLKKTVHDGGVVASLWATWTVSGVRRAFDREWRGLSPMPGRIRTILALDDSTFQIEGLLFNEHFFSNSSSFALSRARRMLVTGQFTFDGELVEVHPYIVGDLVTHLQALPTPWRSQVRIYPTMIDAFARMVRVRSPTAEQIAVLRSVPEQVVKQAVAEILDEPFVPKDWGGEKSDLTTSRITIDQQPLSAAFIFKGPGVRGDLHPADMGRRGDQLVRAFEEPVDLVVVQHWGKIANSVITLAEALASNLARPRRYCILDGADTWRLLTAYGKLPRAIMVHSR